MYCLLKSVTENKVESFELAASVQAHKFSRRVFVSLAGPEVAPSGVEGYSKISSSLPLSSRSLFRTAKKQVRIKINAYLDVHLTTS